MYDKSEQRPARSSNLSSDLAAYIINKRNNPPAGKTPVKTGTPQNPPVPKVPPRSVNDTQVKQDQPHKNIRLVNKVSDGKALEFQILFGELENLLLTLNINDANVQRALIKLNEIRTRVLIEQKKDAAYEGANKRQEWADFKANGRGKPIIMSIYSVSFTMLHNIYCAPHIIQLSLLT